MSEDISNLKKKLTLLQTNEKLLKSKITRLNKKVKELENILDDVPVLRGEAAEQFIEYNSRERTQEEIAHMKEAEEFYLLASTEERENRKMRRIAQGILTNKYDGAIMGHAMKGLRGKVSGEAIQYILELTKEIITNDVMKNINVLDEP